MNKIEFGTRTFVPALAAMLLAVVISWAGVLDRSSGKYVDEALVQAFSTYAVARFINAAVSVLQSVEIQGGVGLSVSASPGEALDPINDLVERFAAIMELSIGSLLIQKLLIAITSSAFFNILLTASVAAFALVALLNITPAVGPLFRTVLTLVFLRFAIVLAILANSWVDIVFLREGIDQRAEAVGSVSEAVSARVAETPTASKPAEEGQQGFFDSFKNGFSALAEKTQGMMSQLDASAAKDELDNAVPNMVDLMAVFILKTILLPLLFLYGLKRVFALLWGWRDAELKAVTA
ncbi:hypothetical protein N5O88_16800 [Pseudomonas sp. GD03721]|nr:MULTISPECIES: hypothetical protein [unclassified Pseudomonas]MDH1443213.1 hypothetical protein [Pseudomonas sp. GD03722]WGG00735.1 hypothetical protein N5O88_16800 [Pseudomonas sp. GD03721]WGG04901.1 hypothetical protein N5O87_16810 [Pseudomonas sp. GD03919]